MRILGIENASHLQKLKVIRVKLGMRGSSWYLNFKMLKNISIEGVEQRL